MHPHHCLPLSGYFVLRPFQVLPLKIQLVAAGGCKRNSTATQVLQPLSEHAPRGNEMVCDEEHEDGDPDEETRACT